MFTEQWSNNMWSQIIPNLHREECRTSVPHGLFFPTLWQPLYQGLSSSDSILAPGDRKMRDPRNEIDPLEFSDPRRNIELQNDWSRVQNNGGLKVTNILEAGYIKANWLFHEWAGSKSPLIVLSELKLTVGILSSRWVDVHSALRDIASTSTFQLLFKEQLCALIID